MKIIMHLGLGDCIVCAPVIAKLAQENSTVELPCWEHNFISVKSFFVDFTNVKIRSFTSENDVLHWAKDAELRLGHYGDIDRLDNEDFVQWFYRQANFNISEKEKYCPLLVASKKTEQRFTKIEFEGNMINLDTGFIHEDKYRNFVINDKFKEHNLLKGTIPSNNLSVLTYVDRLMKAKEIHCIDSSFLHLAETLPTTGKLFYHKYARPGSEKYNYLKKDWRVIDQDKTQAN